MANIVPAGPAVVPIQAQIQAQILPPAGYVATQQASSQFSWIFLVVIIFGILIFAAVIGTVICLIFFKKDSCKSDTDCGNTQICQSGTCVNK